nr:MULTISPECIES: hypothetical protein [unclassified Allomuricauda]
MKIIKKHRSVQFMMVITILAFGLHSCENKEDDTYPAETIESASLPSFTDYLEVYSQKHIEGSVLIEAHNQMATAGVDNAHISQSSDRNGTINKKNRISLSKDGKSILTDKSNTNDIAKTEILDLFGSELQYSYGDEGSKTSETLSIPNLIQIDMNTGVVQAGSVITWNVDPSNEHGVLLYATFSPSNQIDLFLAEQNLQSITRGVVIPDEVGNYVITSEDLEIFPDNSIINVTVARGSTTSGADKSPTVTAISKSSTSVQIDY